MIVIVRVLVICVCAHDCIEYDPCPNPFNIGGATAPDGKGPGHPDCICTNGYCPDGQCKPDLPGGCCPDGRALSDLKNCPRTPGSVQGDGKGIDVAFSSGDFSSVLSVYSLGSMNRPDFICWEMKTENDKKIKIQRRDAFCPPRKECEGGDCPCQTWDSNENPIVQENTRCEYVTSDPMRYEEGMIRGDLPSAGERKGDDASTRFFKTTTIVTP